MNNNKVTLKERLSSLKTFISNNFFYLFVLIGSLLILSVKAATNELSTNNLVELLHVSLCSIIIILIKHVNYNMNVTLPKLIVAIILYIVVLIAELVFRDILYNEFTLYICIMTTNMLVFLLLDTMMTKLKNKIQSQD